MKHVVVGIIMKAGHVLACQRKRTARYPLKWEFPGGKIEAGESAKEALLRELREELAVEADIGEEFFRQDWTYADGSADPQRDGSYRVFYHLIRSFTGDPVNQAFEQIKWVRPSELQSMDILEGNREAVTLLVKHAQKHQAA
jgi:8-oxo-dGTP diphosphatase